MFVDQTLASPGSAKNCFERVEHLFLGGGPNKFQWKDLIISTLAMCNKVSYNEEKKKFRNEGIKKTKEASRPWASQRPQESALLGNAGDQRSARLSNLGCYSF